MHLVVCLCMLLYCYLLSFYRSYCEGSLLASIGTHLKPECAPRTGAARCAGAFEQTVSPAPPTRGAARTWHRALRPRAWSVLGPDGCLMRRQAARPQGPTQQWTRYRPGAATGAARPWAP